MDDVNTNQCQQNRAPKIHVPTTEGGRVQQRQPPASVLCWERQVKGRKRVQRTSKNSQVINQMQEDHVQYEN